MARGLVRATVGSLLLLALAGTAGALDAGFERMRFQDWRIMVKNGHLEHQRGNFDKAFELYTRSACAGDKGSQFALGTMYLMGEGTAADGLRAFAWYKSAAESRESDYVKVFEKVDKLIPAEHRASAEALADATIAAYGKAATRVHCAKRAEVGTKIARLECKPAIDPRTSAVEVKMCGE